MDPSKMPRIAIPTPTSIDLEYNRRCLPLYLEAIRRSGGTPVVLGLYESPDQMQALAESCSGILLPGSPADISPWRYGQLPSPETAGADPLREAADWLLLSDAEMGRKPVLGICYGLQSINVWRGGTLLQDLAILPVNHAAGPSVAVAHTAVVAEGSGLAELTAKHPEDFSSPRTRLAVNSSHHQAIGAVGEGLRITARCAQDGVIEAIERDGSGEWQLTAVQWHPERSVETSAISRALFSELTAAAHALSTSQ